MLGLKSNAFVLIESKNNPEDKTVFIDMQLTLFAIDIMAVWASRNVVVAQTHDFHMFGKFVLEHADRFYVEYQKDPRPNSMNREAQLEHYKQKLFDYADRYFGKEVTA